MSNASKLGLWVRKNYKGNLTHLKLQKLVFYCYGAVLAFGYDSEVGSDISFEPWDNGPVNIDLWRQYKEYGSSVIEFCGLLENLYYSSEVEDILRDVLYIYGLMDSWGLRNQSRLEKPWQEASNKHCSIDIDKLRKHFTQKFIECVKCPEYLLNEASFSLDGIPVSNYPSLKYLVNSLKTSFS